MGYTLHHHWKFYGIYFTLSLKTNSYHDINFVITWATGGCHKLRCYQWQQYWHHDNSQFSVLLLCMSEETCCLDITPDSGAYWTNLWLTDTLRPRYCNLTKQIALWFALYKSPIKGNRYPCSCCLWSVNMDMSIYNVTHEICTGFGLAMDMVTGHPEFI